MARPQKEGLDYFPLDVDIDQDDKLVVPIAKHGMLGFGIIVKLMAEVYKNGYFYPWTEKEMYVFPFKNGVPSEKVCEIVNDCINSGFFCKNQYNRNHILTSYGFQKRYLLASTRRKEATIKTQYLVEKELVQTETELLHTETTEMSAESTQSKLNEIKGKKNTTTTDDEDFYKVLNAYETIHDFQFMPPRDQQNVSKLLNEGIPPEFIISTMKEMNQAKRMKGEKVSGFRYYVEGIRDRHSKKDRPMQLIPGKRQVDWEKIQKQLEEANHGSQTGA